MPVAPSEFDWGAEGVGAAVRRVLDAAGTSSVNEAALLELRNHGLRRASLWVVRSGDTVAGFALARQVGGTTEVDLVVSPESRGHGLGSALADAVLAELDGPVSAWSHGNHPAAAALAASRGFARERDLWVMRRPLSSVPSPREVPDLVVRPFEPGRDEDAFLALNAAAFAHHPEQGSMSRADLDERMAEPWFDPAGFFLADRDGALLGFHWTKVHDAPPAGEIYVLGVSPSAQGMGLGKVLALTGLAYLRSRGLESVLLYVEADNAAAVALYEGIGFTHAPEDTDVQYLRR
jgi:mycothiol synthase